MRRLPDQKFKGIKMGPKVNTYRLFLAIFPPQEYIQYFRDVIRAFDKQKRNLKPIPLDQIHLTLRFFGANVTESSKDALIEEFSRHQGNFPKPTISLGKVSFGFQYQNDPRVILSEVEESDSLVNLAQVVHELTKELGLRDTIRWKEKNAFDFHISLARLKPWATRSVGRDVGRLVEKVHVEVPPPFTAEYVEFMSSEILPTGPVYKKLASIKL